MISASLWRKCPKVIVSVCVTQCVKESSFIRCCNLGQAMCQLLDIHFFFFLPQWLTNCSSIYMAFSHRNLSGKQQSVNEITPGICSVSNASSRSMVGRGAIIKRKTNQLTPTACIREEQGADTSTPQNKSRQQQLNGGFLSVSQEGGRNYKKKVHYSQNL